MNINLFHLKNSRSQIIIWMLEELKLEYSISTPKFIQDNLIPSHFTPIQYPTIKVEVKDQVHYLSETNAIIELLMIHEDKLIPPTNSLETKLNYLYWKNYAISTLLPYIGLKEKMALQIQDQPFITRRLANNKKNKLSKDFIDNGLDRHLLNIENQLSKNKWLLGGYFSIVDILMWYGLEVANTQIDPNIYPNISRYLVGIHGREAFKTSLIAGEWDHNEFKKFWKKAW